jgi:dihydrofolate reductase
MKLVVAVDKNWGIGNKGDLLARIRADLMNFRNETAGKTVVLGSNTLATFPGGRVLKNRTNIVLHPDPSYAPEGAIVAHSLDELFEILKNYNTDDVYIIGGASVYRQMLPHCDTAIITKFDKSFEKDVFIPNLDELEDWRLESVSDVMYSDAETDTEGGLPFTFCTYKRIS